MDSSFESVPGDTSSADTLSADLGGASPWEGHSLYLAHMTLIQNGLVQQDPQGLTGLCG